MPDMREVNLVTGGVLPLLFQREGNVGTDIEWFHGGTSRAFL